LDPVPAADLERAVVAGIPALIAELDPDTRNVLLTLARIWHTTVTGQITSKDAAAEWAAEHLTGSACETVLLARKQYLEGTHGDWAGANAAARQAAEAMVAAIEAT
jgi:streptomycin 3"-adenylyltransferase